MSESQKPQRTRRGRRCRTCGERTIVIDSRCSEDGLVVRRRRECVVCGIRVTTYERDEVDERAWNASPIPPLVVEYSIQDGRIVYQEKPAA